MHDSRLTLLDEHVRELEAQAKSGRLSLDAFRTAGGYWTDLEALRKGKLGPESMDDFAQLRARLNVLLGIEP